MMQCDGQKCHYSSDHKIGIFVIRKGYSTRDLLTKLGAYGYGHKLLLQADKLGLVDRKTVKNKVFNSLTSDGKKIVMIAKEIGV